MNQDIQDVTSGFEKSKERLEEIVSQVRAKDIPLAQSLDLFEEAIALGTKCASLIDNSDFSLAELGLLGDEEPAVEEAPAETAADEAAAGAEADEAASEEPADDGAAADEPAAEPADEPAGNGENGSPSE